MRLYKIYYVSVYSRILLDKYWHWFTMHGPINTKLIDTTQIKGLYKFKNIKRKLYRTNVAIWYNKICGQKRLTPKYINIRINSKKPTMSETRKKNEQFTVTYNNKLYTAASCWTIIDILPQLVLHRVRSSVSSLNFQYPFLSLGYPVGDLRRKGPHWRCRIVLRRISVELKCRRHMRTKSSQFSIIYIWRVL
jgi:hypothetical protein